MVRTQKWRRWLSDNLFGGPLNTLATVAVVALLVAAVPPLIGWALLDAVWRAPDPAACRAADGACWAVIGEKLRVILFGRYPFDQHWRPLLAVLVMLAALAASCDARLWNRWLALIWAAALAVYLALLGGGLFGLDRVEVSLWGGLPLTLLLAVVGSAVAFPIAILLALGRRSELPVFRALSVGYIELIRGVPLVSLLFMGVFLIPLFLPAAIHPNAVVRAQVAIIMFTAAYLAEAVRGGLQAVPRGQYEAAGALGLGYWRVMALVILPQALRVSIPAMVNTFISLFKDTSLVAIVGLADLLLSTRQALADPLWRRFYVEAYIFVAVIYFAFCFFMSRYSARLERRVGAPPQGSA